MTTQSCNNSSTSGKSTCGIKKIMFKLMKPFALVQFSPPRSGSTLVYNIMREIYPTKKIFKVHTLRAMCNELSVVVTYRHPLDCIASSIIRYKREPNQEELERQIKIFDEQGFKNLINIKDKSNFLMLKYEKYVDDYNYIYDRLEIFFNITIDKKKRESITSKYNIKSVEKMISESGDSFSDCDKKTKLHGNHISKYKGASNYYEDFFSIEQIKFLKDYYSDILDTFDYD